MARLTAGTSDSQRVKRINAIGSRYVQNIASMKRFANDVYGGKGLKVARGRKYSRSTYMMGNNEG